MSSSDAPSELRDAIDGLRPYFKQAAGFSLIASLLLAPSWYMLEVYDRVVKDTLHNPG